MNASLGAKTFKELVALAKAKPKTLNYMAAALSKVAFVEDINRKDGIDLVRVPFKGGGDAVNSMMTGTTQIAIFGIGNLIQFIRDGQILGFAVDGDTAFAARSRYSDLPGDRLHQTIWRRPSSASMRRPARRSRSSTNSARRSPRLRPIPNSRSGTCMSRGLTPVLNSPGQFAKELVADRAEGLEAVKARALSRREVTRRAEACCGGEPAFIEEGST